MLELLINVETLRDDDPAVQAGMALASHHQAYVTGLNIIEVYPSTMAMPDVAVVLASEEEEAKACDAWWTGKCQQNGVNGAWEVIRGMYVPVLARRSCMADITISRLPHEKDALPSGMDYLTRALLSSASPMLLVPSSPKEPFRLEQILVAWNSSLPSMHALRASLPLLRDATEVCLIDGSSDELPGMAPPPLPVKDWLKRQGIVPNIVQGFPTGSHVGEALLEHARTMRADLLVMGAWGHSRLNEMVLGGTTRHVLKHTKLPVLVAH
ncbi:universal stress protein [Dyella flagellata]|uniref:Universal stress protein A n=1 Tax=Dyella flagellata TaxID=1867833 RepID=A0ABQ5XEL9_9GAMM|nr:universal stress protein [Dyella flagellata]GLQ89053.1 universal stress protein A [Dyella flagellata]